MLFIGHFKNGRNISYLEICIKAVCCQLLQFIFNLMFLYFFVFSFTLCPAHSSVSKGKLMLIHSVPHFPNSEGIACWRNSTPRFASLPKRSNENIKYIICSSGHQTYNLSCLRSHAYVPVP